MAASGGMWVKTVGGTGPAGTTFIPHWPSGSIAPKHTIVPGRYYPKGELPPGFPKADADGTAYVSPAAHKELRKLEDKIAPNRDFETMFITDANGNLLLTRKGGKHHVDIYPPEYPLVEGGVMTHNHPAASSFSPQDVYCGMAFHMREIRTTGVTKAGRRLTYVMRPPAGGWKTVAKHKGDVMAAALEAQKGFKAAHPASGYVSMSKWLQDMTHYTWSVVAPKFGFFYQRIEG